MSHLPDRTDAQFLLDLLLHKDVTFTLSYLNGQSTNLARSMTLLEQQWTPQWGALLDLRPLADLADVFGSGSTVSSSKVVIDIGGLRLD